MSDMQASFEDLLKLWLSCIVRRSIGILNRKISWSLANDGC